MVLSEQGMNSKDVFTSSIPVWGAVISSVFKYWIYSYLGNLFKVKSMAEIEP